jgi:primosomal protein N' (replication factor Y)
MPETLLKVAINVPLSRQFDYLPPAGVPLPAAGSRVLVPFGRRQLAGLVLGHTSESDVATSRLKRAVALLDDTPLLSEDDLWLIRFTCDYYHHPVGEVAAAALPTLLRKGKALYPVLEYVSATDAGQHADIEKLGKRAPRQAELLLLLIDAGGNGIEADALTEVLPNWRRAAKPLFEKGLISRFEQRATTPVAEEDHNARAGPDLNAAQQAAVAAIQSAAGFAAFLLDGVTGSGKTEVYLRLIEECLAQSKQALVLVPEIGLTPQLISRFRDRLGIEPALLHSGLSDIERLANWRRARSGEAQLVVGTRSAVFTPLPNPGLIVVDEEHDHSFKQQEGLRYSARDLAIARANHASIPVVLGSATPTLELLQHCRSGTYTHLSLPERAGAAVPPTLGLVDLNRAHSDDGLSESLATAIDAHLGEHGQVLLFLNRRGFAPTLICPGCGHVAECERCDSRMTVHAGAQRLRCHHCGANRPLDEACTSCGSAVRPLGAGTERLEDALQQRFPGQTISRIDSDSTQKKGAMEAALAAATSGEARILVGTQMLSKGHHFPHLTLVGIVNADQGLFGTDFRSDERMAQAIVQVAGRAGREERPGEVLIQTAFPEHPFWSRLMEGGYGAVSSDALAERETTHWPPFSRLALLRSAAHKRQDAHAFLDSASRHIERLAGDALRVLGPVDAVMARRAGRYRAQLLLQTGDRRALHSVLRELRPLLEDEPSARKVRWSIDVDPIELM